MRISGILAALVCSLGLLAATARPAQADQVIYDGIGFLVGQQSFTDSFSVNGPGTLTVTLSDIAWPQPLSSLSFVVGNSQGLLGPEMGAGTQSFQIASAGNIYAQWFGTSQTSSDPGVYGIKIQFSPTAVPLPTSIALLLSGLALLAWQRRHRVGVANGSAAAHSGQFLAADNM